MILYMLVCGEAPFQEANDSETLTMIMDCRYTVPDHVSSSCRESVSFVSVSEMPMSPFLQRVGIACCASAVYATAVSVCPSFRHIPMFCLDE